MLRPGIRPIGFSTRRADAAVCGSPGRQFPFFSRPLISDRNWRIVLFVLVALTIVNLSWSFRGPLLDQAWLRNDLIEWGLVQDPSKTMLRDLDHLRLVSRSLQAHALRADALVLQVTFTSDALQAQPWPLMELTLLDSTGGIVAQRR